MNTLLIIVIVILLALWGGSYLRHQYRRNLPPTVGFNLPFFGSMFVIQKHLHELYTFVSTCFHDLYHRKTLSWAVPGLLAPQIHIITCSPEIVEHVLVTKFELYEKGLEFERIFRELLGKGIFVSDGARWYDLRKHASRFFTKRSLLYMKDVFNEHALILVDELTRAAECNEVVNLERVFARYTLDAFGEIAFGLNIDSQRQDVPFADAFDLCSGAIQYRFFMPYWRLPVVGRWFKFERDVAASAHVIDDFARQVIESRRKDSSLSEREDLLSFLIVDDEQKAAQDDEYLRDQVVNFIIAGRDTTAQLLTWLFYTLSTLPPSSSSDVLDSIRAEVASIGSRKPEYEDVKKCKYIEGCLMETLRLFPPVPVNTKKLTNADFDVLPSTKDNDKEPIILRRGDMLNWSVYSMGRDPDLWHEPLRFEPRRWLEDGQRYNGGEPIESRAFVSFHAGRRLCLGKRQALMEAAIVTIHLFQAGISFELTPEQKKKKQLLDWGTTLRSKGGVQVNVIRS